MEIRGKEVRTAVHDVNAGLEMGRHIGAPFLFAVSTRLCHVTFLCTMTDSVIHC